MAIQGIHHQNKTHRYPRYAHEPQGRETSLLQTREPQKYATLPYRLQVTETVIHHGTIRATGQLLPQVNYQLSRQRTATY